MPPRRAWRRTGPPPRPSRAASTTTEAGPLSPQQRELARPRGRLRPHAIVTGAGRKTDLRGQPRHAALDLLAVGARGIAGHRVERAVARKRPRELLRHEVEEETPRHLGPQEHPLRDRLAPARLERADQQLT